MDPIPQALQPSSEPVHSVMPSPLVKVVGLNLAKPKNSAK
jgi:hypothetical protein